MKIYGPKKVSRLFSIEESATFLGVTGRTVINMIARGVLRPVKLPQLRRTLLDRMDLERLIRLGKDDSLAGQVERR